MRAEGPNRHRLVIPTLGAMFVIVLALLPSLDMADTVDTSNSASSSQILSYDFKIYALNCTSQKHVPGGTLFRFTTADLPFSITSVTSGDYRSDASYSHKYYGGSGILVNASGANATMTLKENGGLAVSTISYRGQEQIAFNGKVTSVSYPINLTTYEGTEQMIQDWRNAVWNPEDGVIVEHPSEVTLSDATFFVMIFEPVATTELPEFELLPIVILAAGLFMLVRKVARRS